MPETREFLLPDVGEGLTEAEVSTWHVNPGDRIELNQVLVEIETAKSVVELPSPFEGTVRALHAHEGDVLAVGALLVTIDVAAAVPTETSAERRQPRAPVAEPTQPDASETAGASVLVGHGPRAAANRRVRIRRPAPELTAPRAAYAPVAPEQRIRVSGVRKATAEAMVRSAFTAPHATLWRTVDVTRTMDLVRQLRSDPTWSGTRITPLLFASKAVLLAIAACPDLNAYWDDAFDEIVVRRQVNLGLAVASPRGLLVPNIKNAASLSFRELATEMTDLVTRARAGRLRPVDMADGTVTLTNVGSFGVEGATPILNPPEAAIFALGTVAARPWVVAEEVTSREVMTLSISIDHRLIDGQVAGEALGIVADLLSDPATALTWR